MKNWPWLLILAGLGIGWYVYSRREGSVSPPAQSLKVRILDAMRRLSTTLQAKKTLTPQELLGFTAEAGAIGVALRKLPSSERTAVLAQVRKESPAGVPSEYQGLMQLIAGGA